MDTAETVDSLLAELAGRPPDAFRWSKPADQSDGFYGFDNDRLMAQATGAGGEIEWYFRAREGVVGPYPSRNLAKAMLIRFVARRGRRVADRVVESNRSAAREGKIREGLSMDDRDMVGEKVRPRPVPAAGTPVRYRPEQPEFFSIRFIGQEARVLHAPAPHSRHCFVEFPCGAVLLVLASDIEPVR